MRRRAMTILAKASLLSALLTALPALIACGAKDGSSSSSSSSSSSGNTSGGLDCSKAFSCSLGSSGGSGCPAGQTCTSTFSHACGSGSVCIGPPPAPAKAGEACQPQATGVCSAELACDCTTKVCAANGKKESEPCGASGECVLGLYCFLPDAGPVVTDCNLATGGTCQHP